MLDWALLLGGGLLLYGGAEWFVGGASALALALRIPQLLIGLTVVAYGTSAPEIIVGIEAARAGHGDVALGNVIGSNIANIGLILAIAVLVKPALVNGILARRELPVLLISAALLPIMLRDGVVSTMEASALLGLALGYTIWMVAAARTAATQATVDAGIVSQAADDAGAPAARSLLRAGMIAIVGLVILLIGGNLFVRGAVSLAKTFGMSERLVGLTIVAVGTSLPELITSVIAARRGHADIAVGNVLGSNIFNILLCLGAASLAGTVGAPLAAIPRDLAAFGILTVVAAFFIRTERTIVRWEGSTLLALYIAFVVMTIAVQ